MKEQMSIFPHGWACEESSGRPIPESPDWVRNPFQRDRDRIVHAKAFRRLIHKTQVFISPDGDHFRTRLTHTLEMTQISRTIARSLDLNEDLAEAIALGHDLGHTPFGHTGEEALARVLAPHRRSFRHNEHSLRVVDVLEKGGEGLNLTHEVRDGILNHTGQGYPSTREGDMVRDMILTSRERGEIALSGRVYNALMELRTWLFKNVYHNPRSRENHKAGNVVAALFDHYLHRPEERVKSDPDSVTETIDFVAGMTDRYALAIYKRNFLPRSDTIFE